LTTDLGTSGIAPYTLIFTAEGSDDDGTISKVTFDFGDGTIEDVTEGVEIGLSTITLQKTHTYDTAGNFEANVILTDDENSISEATTCTVEINITDDGEGGSLTSTPTPTIAAPGPGDAIVGIGILGGVLFLIGALLFFAL
jgi:hypothetical protein